MNKCAVCRLPIAVTSQGFWWHMRAAKNATGRHDHYAAPVTTSRCAICGPVEANSPEEHLASDEHRNAAEVEMMLREKFYLPKSVAVGDTQP